MGVERPAGSGTVSVGRSLVRGVLISCRVDSARKIIVAVVGALSLLGGVSCSTSERGGAGGAGPAGVSIEEHWADLLEIEDGLERTAAMAQFVTTLEPEDVEAVRELATNRYRRQRAIEDLLLISFWTRHDPQAVIETTMRSRAPFAGAARVDGAWHWASIDPLAAIAAVPTDEPELVRSLVRGWYDSGKPGLDDFVLSQGTHTPGQMLITKYARELRHDGGAKAVIDWMDSVRDRSDVEDLVVVHVHRKGLAELAVADPAAALAYCEEHCGEPYAESAIAVLSERLGKLGEGPRALSWLTQKEVTDPTQRGNAVRFAFRAWLLQEREAALAWADQALPRYTGQPWFSRLASLVREVYTRREPEKALLWVQDLPEREQEAALITIAHQWLQTDREAAEVWLAGSPLDEAARDQARRGPQRQRSAHRPR
jgi:hypothetical protein